MIHTTEVYLLIAQCFRQYWANRFTSASLNLETNNCSQCKNKCLQHSTTIGHLCYLPIPQNSSTIMPEIAERWQKLEIREDQMKRVSSGYIRATRLMNSQQQWLPLQDLHKFKPVNIPAWREEGSHKPLFIDEALFSVAGGWEDCRKYLWVGQGAPVMQLSWAPHTRWMWYFGLHINK